MRKIELFAVCLCAAIVFVGCSGAKLPTEFVTGVVTLDGEPLADARIFFNPEGGGVPAVGHTDARGVYVITAMQGGGQGAGTVAGEYAVTFSKPHIVPHERIPDSYVTHQLLPLVYIDPAQTPFHATVVKGKNHFDFALESKPAIQFVPPPGFRR